MVAETTLAPAQLVLPVFVREGATEPKPDRVDAGRRPAHPRLAARERPTRLPSWGSAALMLFGIPESQGRRRLRCDSTPRDVLNVAITDVVAEVGDVLTVMSDLCLDEFTDHGHCGVLTPDGRVDNDRTLEVYVAMALAQADAGVDMVGPSGMMDGQVRAVRDALDAAAHTDVVDPGLLRQVRLRLLRPVPRGRRLLAAGRPSYLPAGPRQRPRRRP